MGYKTIEKGYYWVKFYNHERKMILFYTGVFWEQFKHDDRIHDEIESYERVAEPSSVPQANELLPHVSNSLLDLDGKTIPVTFHVSKFEPKIDIDLSNDC